ncbi:unnamed protein product [Nippostrongylus brasiliensis]|uniref:WD_REPEATS_REGION domain-containing protein n=1 Tax=Nippostrongylus brasiliensis TaxID=27835 RepID=A0A158R324_NIPBR|nr:unnamed protein product [Nippostrongylus brasiliensis]
MVVFVIWTVLLAFVVHEHKGFPFNSSAMSDGLDASHPLFGSTRPQWEMWSERTFKWWPALFAEFNISLTGEYISFLPPIVLKTTVDASDSSLYVRPSQHSLHVKKAAPPSEISYFMAGVSAKILPSDRMADVADKCDCIRSLRVLLGALEDRKDSKEGERILKLRRSRGVDDTSTESFPAVWCIAAKQYIAVCGCADGSLEVACLERNKLIGFVGSRVVLARLDGSVEFLELTLTTERVIYSPDTASNMLFLSGFVSQNLFELCDSYSRKPTRVTSILLLNVIRAHQKPISLLSCSSLTAISASYDHTLKLFDLRTCQLQSMLHAHSGPVTSICTDHVTNTLFTACEQGVICWWNMSSGELLRSLDIGCTGRTQLACSADYLLGYASEGDFFLWSKDDGSLVSRIAQHHTKKDAAFVSRSLVALGDQLAVTASEFTLTFWDLQHKAIIHQIDLGSIIDKLIALDNQSVLCQCSNTMYRITSPIIRIT